MRRREFITLLGGAVAWPFAGRAQQAGKVHRIGFLGSATAAGSAKAVESLRTGLREFGYVEGTNIAIEFRWAEGICPAGSTQRCIRSKRTNGPETTHAQLP
jgi:putative ABC transport system substrate-binding protein